MKHGCTRSPTVAFPMAAATLCCLYLVTSSCVFVARRSTPQEPVPVSSHSPTDPEMSKPETIHTDLAPAAIGPYSQAVRLGDLLFCSGQIALDPRSGELVGSTAPEQAEQALANLAAVLEAGGSSMGMVVRTTVFLADMADFAAVNEVYAKHFGDSKPARATVAVRELPKGARVEIDCIAHVR